MTLEQTRQLATEFERRLYTINPTFAVENKIDTDEMYAYLNEYAQVLLSKAAEADSVGEPDQYGLILAQSIMPIGNDFPQHMGNVSIFGNKCASFRIQKCFRLLGGSIAKYVYVRTESGDEGDIIITHFEKSAPIVIYNTKYLQKVIQQYDNEDAIFRHNPATIWQQTNSEDCLYIYVFDGAINVTNPGEPGGPNNEISPVQLQVRYIPNIDRFYINSHAQQACQLPMSCFNDLVEGAVQLYIERALSTQSKQQPKEQQKEQNKQ